MAKKQMTRMVVLKQFFGYPHTFTKDNQDVTINSRPKPTTMGITTLVQKEPKQ